jgi:deoxyribonuclease IV
VTSEAFPAGRRIGPHLPLSAGMVRAAERAREIGATAIQVFTDNPTSWRRRSEPPAEIEEFKARLAAHDIGPVAIHAPYLINLAGGNDDFWAKSCATLTSELRMGALFGASFVVVHVGSHRGHGREEGIRRLSEGLKRVLDEADPSGPLLVLENSAGVGDGLGSTIEELADIWQAAESAGVPANRLRLCLDTAHLWSAGYALNEPDAIDALLARIDELLGRDKVTVLHLNDARTVVGSRLDRHEHIGDGLIGHEGQRYRL